MKKKHIPALCFGLYGMVTLWLLFARSQPELGQQTYWEWVWEHIILTPGRTIRIFWNVLAYPDSYIQNWGVEWYLESRAHAIRNLVGNVLLFLPLGFFPPLIWRTMQAWWKTVGLSVLIMMCLEFLQALAMVGTCDIDDLLLNTLGAFLGYLCFLLAKKWADKRVSP